MPDKAKYILVLLVAALLILLAWDFVYWSGRFPPNCYIENLDVSGLTKYEALKKLRSANLDTISPNPFLLTLEGQFIPYKPSELGMFIAPRKTISVADRFAYRNNYLVDLIKRASNKYEMKVIPLSLDINKDIFKGVLAVLANNFDVASKEASFVLTDQNITKVTKERVGKKVSIERSIKNVGEALNVGMHSSEIAVDTLYPRVYAKDLVRYPPKYLLAEYTTYYGSHDSRNRIHNIKLAASRTNNYVIVSGEVFSLLSLLGDFNGDGGYKEAFVLYNGELDPQMGGGSCQIASTLYNAAILAGLDVIERHNHGIYFTIYPLGRDSSIYSPNRDLRIGNNTNHPVYIKTYATDKKLTYRIYGTPTGKKVRITRPMIFFEGEKFVAYDLGTDEAKEKINQALLNGKPYYTYIKVLTEYGGYTTDKTIWSHYKMTGDRENVKIVRPEPE